MQTPPKLVTVDRNYCPACGVLVTDFDKDGELNHNRATPQAFTMHIYGEPSIYEIEWTCGRCYAKWYHGGAQ